MYIYVNNVGLAYVAQKLNDRAEKTIHPGAIDRVFTLL
jgi:hypothetical protein